MRIKRGAVWGAGLVAGLLTVSGARAFDCLIEPSQVVELRSSVDGIIAAVHIRRGDQVRKGQVLVELQSAAERSGVDGARFRAGMEGQITSARSRLDYATLKARRATELQRENFASIQARDEADAERRLAESELVAAIEGRELARIDFRRAEQTLALRTLAAPFNGVVLDRMLHPGDLAEAGSGRKPVLRLAQIDPLNVDIVLPAVLHGSVKIGAKASVTPVGSQAALQATVSIIDRVIDAASGTFVVRLELPNPRQSVLGGVRCTADIVGVSQIADVRRPKGK
jgi:RND family efflux transporter MFP subunit